MIDPKKLHKKFVQLGRIRHKLKNELLAILPEIYKSGIYKKYSSSIVEYAGKYGDIAKSTVKRRLGLEKKLSDKPHLRKAIKEVGLQKVAMVASLATPETDEAFADKVKNMSKSAVQTLAKELREKKKKEQNFPSRCHAKAENIKIELDEETSFMFLKLKKKMGENMSNRELMRKILGKMVEEEFPSKKSKSVTGHTLSDKKKGGEASRYIPTDRKKSALTETNKKCGYPNCNRPAEVFHHRERFAKNKNHESIIPLCKNHHEFAHNGLVENEIREPQQWELNIQTKPRYETDYLYRTYRKSKLPLPRKLPL